MAKALDVFYDGKVFRPETMPDIAPNMRYRIVIEEAGLVAGGMMPGRSWHPWPAASKLLRTGLPDTTADTFTQQPDVITEADMLRIGAALIYYRA